MLINLGVIIRRITGEFGSMPGRFVYCQRCCLSRLKENDFNTDVHTTRKRLICLRFASVNSNLLAFYCISVLTNIPTLVLIQFSAICGPVLHNAYKNEIWMLLSWLGTIDLRLRSFYAINMRFDKTPTKQLPLNRRP